MRASFVTFDMTLFAFDAHAEGILVPFSHSTRSKDGVHPDTKASTGIKKYCPVRQDSLARSKTTSIFESRRSRHLVYEHMSR